jgi:hypothetical protein
LGSSIHTLLCFGKPAHQHVRLLFAGSDALFQHHNLLLLAVKVLKAVKLPLDIIYHLLCI